MTWTPVENRTNIKRSSGWLGQGLRSAVFLRPELSGLRAGPLTLALLCALLVGVGVLLQRVGTPGPVVFYWQAIASGWLTTMLLLWACWLAARSRPDAPDTATLFGMLLIQELLISLPLWALYLLLPHASWLTPPVTTWLLGTIPFVVVGWVALAGVVLVLRHTAPGGLRVVVLLSLLTAGAVDLYAPPLQFWYPDMSARSEDAADDKRLRLTQETLEQQSATLVDALNGLQAQRPGVADVYAITFAPYAGEDVFRRESGLVSELMRSRFDAQGRTLQLINHAHTARELPWATGLNLRRAIDRVASLMDRNEDLLFIHLTSHGAKDGQLAADFEPLQVEPVTPVQLRAWLDEAGIRYRVVSVSACYSGTWLPALAGPGTLMLTASDANTTSYGCGRLSELTFFGRAMYGEQLRSTRSFEQAHATARKVIEKREQEAGKTDGYSNPQIAMGELIRPMLAALAARLDAAAP